MKSRGRPAFKNIPLIFWVLVEVMRDRKEPGRDRDTVRNACKRLEMEFAKDFNGPRELKSETIRRYYKKFEKTLRRLNSGEELAKANAELFAARTRRDFLGWDTSPWMFVISPAGLAARGVNVVIPRVDEFLMQTFSDPKMNK